MYYGLSANGVITHLQWHICRLVARPFWRYAESIASERFGDGGKACRPQTINRGPTSGKKEEV